MLTAAAARTAGHSQMVLLCRAAATPAAAAARLSQVGQLSGLIELINGELSKLDRKKLITLCTIDVHARDVVQRLIDERVESASCFQWQSQMRYVVSERSGLAQVNVSDAEIAYSWEYIGNCGSLCITPLTDRCYITLTQAQRLILGGAPAGPAGARRQEYPCPAIASVRVRHARRPTPLPHRPRRHGQDGDGQGPCACSWSAVLRLQLQRPDGLQGHGPDLQGPCADWSLGVL